MLNILSLEVTSNNEGRVKFVTWREQKGYRWECSRFSFEEIVWFKRNESILSIEIKLKHCDEVQRWEV